ncbi:hypothetical protein BX265_0348 [Streptomyces sp. TLI_235]|nr:hypothetical protein [Streptomyces sp. TLI_235]PBC75677.1 hypothetical protein BX265_0348 [Streptomyces sp. TLI_235]
MPNTPDSGASEPPHAAAPSVPDWVALAAGTRTTAHLDAMVRFATLFYEPFFMTGGLLFALASLRTPGRRRPRR